jgi:hypothetical protein
LRHGLLVFIGWLEGFAKGFPEKKCGWPERRSFAKLLGFLRGVLEKAVGKCGFLMVRLW